MARGMYWRQENVWCSVEPVHSHSHYYNAYPRRSLPRPNLHYGKIHIVCWAVRLPIGLLRGLMSNLEASEIETEQDQRYCDRQRCELNSR